MKQFIEQCMYYLPSYDPHIKSEAVRGKQFLKGKES